MADFVGQANRFAGSVSGPSGEGYQVAVEGAGTVAAQGPLGLAPGAGVSVIVRPENIGLDGATGFPATVTSVSYLGPSRSVRLDAGGLGPILATVAGDGQAGGRGRPRERVLQRRGRLDHPVSHRLPAGADVPTMSGR